MAMVDMKVSKKKRDEMNKPMDATSDRPEYPYGLCLSLEDESIKKLGIDYGTCRVGKTYNIIATAVVKGMTTRDNDHSSSKYLELQIQKMEVGKDKFDTYKSQKDKEAGE